MFCKVEIDDWAFFEDQKYDSVMTAVSLRGPLVGNVSERDLSNETAEVSFELSGGGHLRATVPVDSLTPVFTKDVERFAKLTKLEADNGE